MSTALTEALVDSVLCLELAALRKNFAEYVDGGMSEADFKAAVSRYSAALRRARESVGDDIGFMARLRAAAKTARTSGALR